MTAAEPWTAIIYLFIMLVFCFIHVSLTWEAYAIVDCTDFYVLLGFLPKQFSGLMQVTFLCMSIVYHIFDVDAALVTCRGSSIRGLGICLQISRSRNRIPSTAAAVKWERTSKEKRKNTRVV